MAAPLRGQSVTYVPGMECYLCLGLFMDRYCSWPGQACGYKVGHSEINRQRQKAIAALGGKYDLKAFDDTVVLGGNVPLDVLAKNVDEYVRTAKG